VSTNEALAARPASRNVLRAELVGSAFMDYLAADWDDLVA